MATDLDAARTELRRHNVTAFHPWRLARPQAAWVRDADNQLNGGWLIAGAAPGTPPFAYPSDGMAAFVKAGTRLLFETHTGLALSSSAALSSAA